MRKLALIITDSEEYSDDDRIKRAARQYQNVLNSSDQVEYSYKLYLKELTLVATNGRYPFPQAFLIQIFKMPEIKIKGKTIKQFQARFVQLSKIEAEEFVVKHKKDS